MIAVHASRLLRVPVRRGQCGQALVLALVVLFGGLLGLFFLFSTGQVIAAKQRLVNAADAAAWSSALWRARVFNFQAYANRAIVAQEVAVAQAVTLVSWAKYFEQFTANASVLATAWPPAAPVLEAAASVAQSARELTELAAAQEILVRAAPSTGYKSLLARSQEVLELAAGSFGLGAVANEIVRASDRRFFAFALGDGGAFSAFSRRYESDEDRARLRDVVTDSLDGFVRGPRSENLQLLLLPSSCFGRSTNVEQWFRSWRKRGGTDLAPDLERWQAVDTASIHNWRRSGLLRRSCRRQEWLPTGWGAAQASDGSFADEIVGDPGSTRDNPGAMALAEAGITGAGHAGFGQYSGIERVRELNYEALADDRFPVSQVVILARQEARDVRTANALDVGTGRLRLFEAFAGQRLWAMAVGEAYFRRPPAAPARIEYASLYSPYWQARLAAPTEAQRVAAEAYAY